MPKVVTYETPTKKVDIPVQVVEEGVIQALGPPYKGGSGLYTTDVKKGTLGVNTTHKGQYCLLSAAHVLTCFNRANSERRFNTWSESREDHQPMGTTVED